MIASEIHQDSLFIQGISGDIFSAEENPTKNGEKDEENLVTTIFTVNQADLRKDIFIGERKFIW